jgi:MFS transporter, PPP family, 3-phenylpropionic acid transporter
LPAIALPYWRLSAWYLFYFAFFGAFNPYVGLYLKSLGVSAPGIGVLLGLSQITRLVAPNLCSALAERCGAKTTVIRWSAAVAVLAFAGFFIASGFAMLFIVMALLAFCSTGALPLAEALTLAHLQHRMARYGSIRLWGSIGFILAVQGVGILLDATPLATLLGVCLLLLLGTLAAALMLPEAPPAPVAPAETGAHATMRSPKVVALFAACFLMSAAHAPLYAFYSIHLVDHGYSKTAVGALWSLGVIAEIGVFLLMSRLMRRVSLRTILAASFALAVIRFLVIGWGIQWPLAVIVAQLLHGATFGAHHAASVAALNRWFAPRHQARALALYGGLCFGAGGMVGNLLSGLAWDSLGAGATYSFASVFAGLGLLLVWRRMRAE